LHYSTKKLFEWRPFAHVAIDHQPLTTFKQWKALAAISGCDQSQRGQTGCFQLFLNPISFLGNKI